MFMKVRHALLSFKKTVCYVQPLIFRLFLLSRPNHVIWCDIRSTRETSMCKTIEYLGCRPVSMWDPGS